jgi:predicted GNAT superfamily acetyltransferase
MEGVRMSGEVGRGDGYRIRELESYDQIRDCVAIQERTWGPDFHEIVPAAILWVAARTGGIVAGAYDPADRLVGFVFGISGYREGRPLHWSDMLAVLPEARGAGLGRALKEHQRRVLLQRGIRDVFWTFDPLESRNAHLNFARLGAVAREYIRDCYGTSQSPLHRGLGTDRLVAHWQLASPRVRERMENAAGAWANGAAAGAGAGRPPVAEQVASLPLANAEGGVALPEAPLVRVRIPGDIQALKDADPGASRHWRESTRAAFETYLGRGYTVVELVRESAEWSSYLLEAPSGEGSSPAGGAAS